MPASPQHGPGTLRICCGPGNSTELLQARFPDAVITAMDSSADMIEAARKRLSGVQLEINDILRWRNPGPFDLILANAALQWIPDHESLLPELVAKLAPGGSLAVQVPDNLDEPAHCIMREVAADGPWAAKLADTSNARAARRGAEWYYRLLHGCGVSVDIWQTTYYHGSVLLPFPRLFFVATRPDNAPGETFSDEGSLNRSGS